MFYKLRGVYIMINNLSELQKKDLKNEALTLKKIEVKKKPKRRRFLPKLVLI